MLNPTPRSKNKTLEMDIGRMNNMLVYIYIYIVPGPIPRLNAQVRSRHANPHAIVARGSQVDRWLSASPKLSIFAHMYRYIHVCTHMYMYIHMQSFCLCVGVACNSPRRPNPKQTSVVIYLGRGWLCCIFGARAPNACFHYLFLYTNIYTCFLCSGCL